MPDYITPPYGQAELDGTIVASFVSEQEQNMDAETITSFGEEWRKFNSFSEHDLDTIGHDYFDLLKLEAMAGAVVLDVGCGSGRWARFLSPYVSAVEAIDPSEAVLVAARSLRSFPNVRVTRAGVGFIPFADSTFDLVYSLGVLHHVPDTQQAIDNCFRKVKSGGNFLLYVYYYPEERAAWFRALFHFSNGLRRLICRLPGPLKRVTCDLIAVFIYWPLAKGSRVVGLFSKSLGAKIPLSYYGKTSFFIMRNDSLDRFGTPLEKRFTKTEIEAMLIRAGFRSLQFSEKPPYWHVLAKKD